MFRALTLLLTIALAPTAADAGWMLEWNMTAFNQKGDRLPSEAASQSIANNRARMDQPAVITITDYDADRFALLNPAKQYFWSGTLDEYLREMAKARGEAVAERMGKVVVTPKPGQKAPPADYMPPPIDPATLPPVAVAKTGLKEKIAGYDTEKYEVRIDGTLFEELWIAPGVNLSADLNPQRFAEAQRKITTGMLGKSAIAYNAVYRNEEYLKLLGSGFPLKVVTRHIAGGFERVATSVRQGDVAASTFEVPSSYRKVRLNDVLEPLPPDAAPPQRKDVAPLPPRKTNGGPPRQSS